MEETGADLAHGTCFVFLVSLTFLLQTRLTLNLRRTNEKMQHSQESLSKSNTYEDQLNVK